MIYPDFLKQGDLIGVPAPSDAGSDEAKKARFINAKKKIESLGYKVRLSKNINNSIKGRSSSAVKRAEEINEMFEDKDIRFISCASGGEFLVEILPYIDFNKIVKDPKWVEGFSDPTGILFPITTKYDIATIYGTNFSNYGMEEYEKDVLDNLEIIVGDRFDVESYDMYEEERSERITGLEGYNLTQKVEWKSLNGKEVNVSGRIIAGCFDIIAELVGTKYDGIKEFNERYKEDGIIFCFDNCSLSKEEIIRVLWKLNEFDYFKYAKAIIFGRNGVEASWLNLTMEETLTDSVIANLNIPIVYNTDISHKSPCLNIINGSYAKVHYKDGKGKISFELK